ncbi:hypothetical protein, partial [Myroides marinus]|uniref:hypothetical protein n=1 Tax=Myroides marinus TaxID=703342 RepID=UPI00257552EA
LSTFTLEYTVHFHTGIGCSLSVEYSVSKESSITQELIVLRLIPYLFAADLLLKAPDFISETTFCLTDNGYEFP